MSLILRFAAALCLVTSAAFAQDGSVKVTSARANVRSDASDKAPVVIQLTLGTEVILKAVEGDWYRIQLPPNPMLGGARVEAYISKKVAKLISMPSAAAPVPIASTPPEHPELRHGMSVAQVVGTGTTWLTPETARLRIVTEAAASSRALASVLPTTDPPLPTSAPAVTFAWAIDGPSSARPLDDARPSFVVQFKGVPGFAPDDLVPALVRLAPTVSGVRVISLVRGRLDVTGRTEADWDVVKDLKQDAIRATVDIAESGAARVQPAVALDPGEYAIVLRPSGKKRYSGTAIFDGPLFTTLWSFTIR